MHIPDGFVSAPVNVATAVVATGVCGTALVRARKTLGESDAPLLGMTAAFLFAAQMLNFPVAAGTSGHFLGALFAALMLGPWSACLVLSLVLLIQCLGFQDGGLTALGTNALNMGVVGVFAGYGVFGLLRAVLPKTRTGFLAAVGVAAWVSVVAASALAAMELAFSGTSPLALVLPVMIGVHALIGVGEAVITVAAVSTVVSVRPDLVTGWRSAVVEVRT